MGSEPQAVIGIEGGATRTSWVQLGSTVSSEPVILARGELPPANLRLISDTRLESLFRFLPESTSRVGICLAGCGSEADRQRVARIAARVWPKAALHVGSDRDSAFSAAFGNKNDGIVVIAGTGSAVSGRNGDMSGRAGGRGHLLGDRGSAYQLALDAIQSVLETYDLEARLTPFGTKLLAQLELRGIDDIVAWTQKASKTQIAGLAPSMIKAALAGDTNLMSILREGARSLAQYTRSVARRLNQKKPNVELLGGLFQNCPEYVELFNEELKALRQEACVHVCQASGALGAALFALHSPRVDAEPSAVLAQAGLALTEQLHPGLERAEELSTRELVWMFIEDERHVAEALLEQIDELCQSVELIAKKVKSGGRLIYVGAGTSGRLGVLDASEIPPTFGASPEKIQGIIAGGLSALHTSAEGAEDDREAGIRAIQEKQVGPNDVVCGITASGQTPFVLAALAEARRREANTVLLSCNPLRTRNGVKWDEEIDLPTGPELVTGSTRLKAGTATKVALNMLSTCVMIRLGKLKGNYMIDMHVTNDKLRERALRFVCQIKACSSDEGLQLLEKYNWNVRKALETKAR